eukprot:84256-Rhodomonas_salina.2
MSCVEWLENFWVLSREHKQDACSGGAADSRLTDKERSGWDRGLFLVEMDGLLKCRVGGILTGCIR